jgi:hypothetical protein
MHHVRTVSSAGGDQYRIVGNPFLPDYVRVARHPKGISRSPVAVCARQPFNSRAGLRVHAATLIAASEARFCRLQGIS